MIDLEKIQKEVYQNKVNKGFNVKDVNMEFCLAYGEMGEAYEAWIKKKEDLGEELADVVIYLLGLSEILGINLEDEIVKKVYKNTKREYKVINGVTTRVKEYEANKQEKIKLLFATGNDKKYELMKRRLKDFKEIELIMPKHINLKINVKEDGKTAEENALIKARQYYKAANIPVIAEDSGLYIEKFPLEEQPGLFVKRVNGREDLSDEEVLKYYIDKLEKVGGESKARYKTGVAIINKEGKEFSTTIDEEEFVMTKKINNTEFLSGGILDLISFDPINNKYFNELNDEEKARRYKKIDDETKEMIYKVFYNK